MLHIELYKNMGSGKVKLEVVSETPTVKVTRPSGDLLSGVEQTVSLTFQTGTHSFQEASQVSFVFSC